MSAGVEEKGGATSVCGVEHSRLQPALQRQYRQVGAATHSREAEGRGGGLRGAKGAKHTVGTAAHLMCLPLKGLPSFRTGLEGNEVCVQAL